MLRTHLSSGAGTVGQLVADVPSGLSLTPPTNCLMYGIFCSRYYEMPVEAAASHPERPNESTHLQGLVHCIQRLVALCRHNAHNCMLLANSDLMTNLLKGFTYVLSVSESKFSGKCMVIRFVSCVQ
jgi:hypothetical protein